MALIPLTETGLRSAMRDRRYWQSGHPEREAYVGWVSHGWRALEGSPYQDPSGSSVVFVQAYMRVRDGHTEEVSAHQRSAPARTGDNSAGGAHSQQTGSGTEAPNTTPNGAAPPRPSEISTNGAAFLYQWEAQVGVSDRPHWPGGTSGVTLGPGYDMGGRTREQVQGDLTAAGLPADTAAALATGAGLRGQDAGNFATSQRDAVRLTDDQQQALMTVAAAPAQRAVTNAVTVPLNQNQYDALTSLAYNIGTGAFQRSTLLRRLNAGDFTGAAEQFGVWVRSGGADSPGLIARRAAERRPFEFPVGTEGAVP